jgi:mannosyltransferase
VPFFSKHNLDYQNSKITKQTMPQPPPRHSTVSRTPSGLRVRPNRVSVILLAGTFFACVAWALASRYVAPEIIRSAYYGTGWPVLNKMIVTQASHPLSYYLNLWNEFAWHMLLVLMLSGLFVLLVAQPEFRNAFWGPEPVIPAPGPGAKATVRGMTADDVELSWREKLAGFAHSREMALLFGAILLLALLLRLLYLGANSFDEDEIFSVIFARVSLPSFLWTVTHREANMVLYYTILRFWINLGQSELAIRSFSVILALATVPVLYLMGTRAFGRRDVGSLGALLLAINGFHIEYSQQARSYALLLFLVTLSSLFFLQSVRQGSRRNWIRYIVTSTLAIYAHLFAVLVLVAHWVFLLFLPRRLAPWRRLVPSTAAIAFLALPKFLVLFGDTGELSWVPRTTARSVYNLFACLAGKPDNISLLGYGPALLLFVYSIPVAISILALAKSRAWSMDHAETWHLAFFLTWLLVPILVVLAISLRKPVFYIRFLIICLPPFILLASHGFSRLRRAWLVVALLCVIAGLTAPGLLVHYKHPDQDWRGIAQYVLSNLKPGDAAVVIPTYCQSRVEYYLQRRAAKPAGSLGPKLTFLVPSSDSSFGPLLQGLAQYDRVWLILRQSATRRKMLNRWPAEETFISVPIGAAVAQERSIEASLAIEFPGTHEEKRFSGELVVVLYHK